MCRQLRRVILLLFLQHVCNPYFKVAAALSQQGNLHLKIGTRPSPLAQKQAHFVATALEKAQQQRSDDDDSFRISTEIVVIESLGEHKAGVDKAAQDLPLAMTPSVDFTSTIDNAILNGHVDVGVHSVKDIPPMHRWKSQLVIGACMPRVCPLDVLVTANNAKDGYNDVSLKELPLGARIGSASMRRQAQLLAIRPDCKPVNLRGNVQTRLQALNDGLVDALVMAKAGLDRLGLQLDNNAKAVLESHEMLPCPGQGIVGVVCRADNVHVLEHLQMINNQDSAIAAIVERAILDAVDGLAPWEGRPPVAAYLEKETSEDEQWLLRALLAKPDGTEIVRAERRVPCRDCLNEQDALDLGREVGNELLQYAGADFLSKSQLENVK